MADDMKPAGRTLYEEDFYAWTKTQAAVLRAGRNGADALDFDKLAEEVEDLGNEQRWACESDLEHIVEHLLKIQLVRSPRTVRHWKAEIAQFRKHLGKRLTKTIRNALEPHVGEMHAEALRDLVRLDMVDRKDPLLAATRPFTWAEITDPEFFTEPLYPRD